MNRFDPILKRAIKRKGSKKILFSLMPNILSTSAVKKITDDRFLSMMAKCIFRAGFHWKVIDKKWPEFEQAFHRFDPVVLIHKSPDEWDAYMQDTRIVRNWQKIQAVYNNALFVNDVTEEHGSFSQFISSWPSDDQVGLMLYLKKNGSRLGGNTGMYFLRYMGMDSFILSQDVVLALQDSGLDIADNPTSQRDLKKIQKQFNDWHKDSGYPYSQLSKIAAYSCGQNYQHNIIQEEMEKVGEKN